MPRMFPELPRDPSDLFRTVAAWRVTCGAMVKLGVEHRDRMFRDAFLELHKSIDEWWVWFKQKHDDQKKQA